MASKLGGNGQVSPGSEIAGGESRRDRGRKGQRADPVM